MLIARRVESPGAERTITHFRGYQTSKNSFAEAKNAWMVSRSRGSPIFVLSAQEPGAQGRASLIVSLLYLIFGKHTRKVSAEIGRLPKNLEYSRSSAPRVLEVLLGVCTKGARCELSSPLSIWLNYHHETMAGIRASRNAGCSRCHYCGGDESAGSCTCFPHIGYLVRPQVTEYDA